MKGLVGSKGRLWDSVNIKGAKAGSLQSPANSSDEMRGAGLHSLHKAERRL